MEHALSTSIAIKQSYSNVHNGIKHCMCACAIQLFIGQARQANAP
jgi:hypothetical protein